jgi:hypothetical protein
MSDKSRRKLLKSIAAGSGAIVAGKSLPESWSRPVVDSVLLPAHAQTSATIFSGFGILGGSAPFALTENNTLTASITDSLLPEAMAGNGGNQAGYFACAIINGTSVNIHVAGLGSRGIPENEAFYIRRGTLDLNGAVGTITASGSDVSPCASEELDHRSRPARVASYNDNQLVLQILTRCGEGEGDENDCNVPVRVVTIPRRDAGCVGEPAIYTGLCPMN